MNRRSSNAGPVHIRNTAPLWIMGVGIIAVLAPPPGVVTGVFLLLAAVIVVPVVITSML